MLPKKEQIIDHINGNSLDNRRCNLRIVTRSENGQNRRGAASNSKTGIRGVNICISNKGKNCEKQHYIARVTLNKKHVFQKLFPFTPEGLKDAEKAVTEARLKHFTHNETDKGANND